MNLDMEKDGVIMQIIVRLSRNGNLRACDDLEDLLNFIVSDDYRVREVETTAFSKRS